MARKPKPGRPPTTLAHHIWNGGSSFRPSRHGHLLGRREWIPEEYEHHRRRYRTATTDRERQAVVLDFRDAIHRDHGMTLIEALHILKQAKSEPDETTPAGDDTLEPGS